MQKILDSLALVVFAVLIIIVVAVIVVALRLWFALIDLTLKSFSEHKNTTSGGPGNGSGLLYLGQQACTGQKHCLNSANQNLMASV